MKNITLVMFGIIALVGCNNSANDFNSREQTKENCQIGCNRLGENFDYDQNRNYGLKCLCTYDKNLAVAPNMKPSWIRGAEAEGFTNIKDEGMALWGCAEDDSSFASHFFTGLKNGKEVEATACCGLWLKGCTIRYR